MRSFLFMAAAAPEIYTLSLHDALPIWSDHVRGRAPQAHAEADRRPDRRGHERQHLDRKSTRLNSSHTVISYAAFCLKKKTRAEPTGSANAHAQSLLSTRAGTATYSAIC